MLVPLLFIDERLTHATEMIRYVSIDNNGNLYMRLMVYEGVTSALSGLK